MFALLFPLSQYNHRAGLIHRHRPVFAFILHSNVSSSTSKKSEQQFSEKASAFQSHIFLSVELLMVGIESIAVWQIPCNVHSFIWSWLVESFVLIPCKSWTMEPFLELALTSDQYLSTLQLVGLELTYRSAHSALPLSHGLRYKYNQTNIVFGVVLSKKKPHLFDAFFLGWTFRVGRFPRVTTNHHPPGPRWWPSSSRPLGKRNDSCASMGSRDLEPKKPTKMVISWGFCIGIPWVVENPILMEY